MAVHWGGRGPGHLSRSSSPLATVTDGPTLILDFVPTSGTSGYTLDLTFVEPLSAYTNGSFQADFTTGGYAVASASVPTFAAHVPDPLTGGITNIQVWN